MNNKNQIKNNPPSGDDYEKRINQWDGELLPATIDDDSNKNLLPEIYSPKDLSLLGEQDSGECGEDAPWLDNSPLKVVLVNQ